jgi:hypothetical protein
MYSLLNELQQAKLIQVEDQYPFEDVKILRSASGWNALQAIAEFAEERRVPLREMLVGFRTAS